MNKHDKENLIKQAQALYEAVKDNDIHGAAFAIHRGANQSLLNGQSYDSLSDQPSETRQRSPLQVAVYKTPNLLHLLLENGADVHEYNDKAIRTCAGSPADTSGDNLRVLIKHGADVNANHGEPLLNAVLHGSKEQIDMLTYHGADLYLVNRDRVQDELQKKQGPGSAFRKEYLDSVSDKMDLLEVYQESFSSLRHVPGRVRRMDLSHESREILSSSDPSISESEKEILDTIIMKNETQNQGFMLNSYDDLHFNHEDYSDELRQAAFDEYWDGETPEDEFKEECWQDSYTSYQAYLERNTVEGAMEMDSLVAEDVRQAMTQPRAFDEPIFDINERLLECCSGRSSWNISDDDATEAWLSLGADVNHENGKPLINAATNGKKAVAQTLIDHGAEPTPEAINAAQEYGHRETAEIIQAKYEQDLLRRHLGQVSQSEGLSQTPQPSRRQRL